ncbi:MAG: hypothetical protein QOJ23_4916 [Actinomycetota bacterium]|jgi:hypothetical protein|nr:hypothetical protein [Actinomycetota bacterium]
MSQQNRVTPEGEIVAIALPGLFMGNRGRLHEGREIVRAWKTRNWLVCDRDFRGRRVVQWSPDRYTPLFFHDEAVAFAAGHRPCAECRHQRYRAWCDAWEEAFGERPSAGTIDRRLHGERLDGRVQRRHQAPWADLPDGAFVHSAGRPRLVWGEQLVAWTATGYEAPGPRPTGGTADVLTPPATLAVLGHGYRPDVAFAGASPDGVGGVDDGD